MRIYQEEDEPKFKPITIVLETEEDARLMWYSLAHNCKRDGEGRPDNHRIWSCFNDIYHPMN